MDSAARNFPPGDLRVSDADRDRALAELSDAFRVGRITAGEFDQRSGQALAARTGKELTALLADLPLDRAPATPATAADRALRVLGDRRVMVASALAATTFAAVAATNALSSGPALVPTLARAAPALGQAGGTCPAASGSACTELIQEMAAHAGQLGPWWSSNISLSPSPGFDWAGTLTPAAVAVLFVVLIIFLRVTRAGRP
ncbi:MAG: DUF1707 SHOCT-like domain-containing protein [Streptosporangiaceae bacterium]